MTPRTVARAILNRAPRSVRLSLLVKRREHLMRDAGIVFIHIPKVAGSSINQAIYGRFMGHYTARQVERVASRRVRALPRFTVVRNPWARTVSAWRFSRIEKGIGDGINVGMAPGLYDIPEFETFDRFASEWLPQADMVTDDWVFHQQHKWSTNANGQTIVDHVGKLEDLQATIDWVEETIGRRLEISHTNRSGESIDWRSFYTPDTAAVVARVYAEDIRRFGYSPPDL